ncbi:hypothetical protein DYB35_006056 [Aphanomyces astaci]|uniref:Uncharacterized protein n=1 Tax=Aphanomyces astaci TaxID=112090 RepID=A0A3R7A7D7_APHAT|nr:hypothetical protein DYB35_006056 [Aphanomyces astaci]
MHHHVGRRDIDEWTHVLGKPWVDAAWRAYVAATGYPCPSITTSSDSILHSYADLVAATSSIVVTNNHIHIPSSSHLSFLDYLRGFVVHCINSPARPPPTPPSIAAASKPSPHPRAKALEIAHVFATSQFMHDLPPSTENDDPTMYVVSDEGRPFNEGRNLDGHGEDGGNEASGGEAEEDDPAFEWLVHDSSNADGIA